MTDERQPGHSRLVYNKKTRTIDTVGGTCEERIAAAVTAQKEAIPDDLRANGWSVVVHNDYRQEGLNFTFWTVARAGICHKGEGRTDAEALNEIRAAIRGQNAKQEGE